MSYLSGNSKSTSGSDIPGSWQLPSVTLGSAEDKVDPGDALKNESNRGGSLLSANTKESPNI